MVVDVGMAFRADRSQRESSAYAAHLTNVALRQTLDILQAKEACGDLRKALELIADPMTPPALLRKIAETALIM